MNPGEQLQRRVDRLKAGRELVLERVLPLLDDVASAYKGDEFDELKGLLTTARGELTDFQNKLEELTEEWADEPKKLMQTFIACELREAIASIEGAEDIVDRTIPADVASIGELEADLLWRFERS